MDISNWALDRRLQLPDSFFGARWPISVMQQGTLPAMAFDISEMALPEWCVIWEIRRMFNSATAGALTWMKLALGSQLPATNAAFNELEPLFPHYGIVFGGEKVIPNVSQMEQTITTLKYPIHAMGRRVCLRTIGVTGAWDLLVTLVISSIPTEIPDCLLSAVPKNLL